MKVSLLTMMFVSAGAFRSRKKIRKNVSAVIHLSDSPTAEGGEPAVYDDETTDVGKAGAEPSHSQVAPVSETNIRSCGCRYGMYSYQAWPLSQSGSGCIGGCGGGEFQINRYGATIKQLTVWTASSNSNSHIKAIRFTYHDGHSVVKGAAQGGGGPWSFAFQPGEHVVGDLKLSGNGRGTRLGSIEFKTSQNREFKVGMTSPYRYLFPSGGSYITGFTGRSGSEIDMLGVIFWKPIAGITYQSINYPTLNTLARLSSPTAVESRPYCNALSQEMPMLGEEYTMKVTTGSQSCLQSTSTAQFSTSIRASGGFPMIKEVEVEAKWEVSASTTIENCRQTLVETNRKLIFPAVMVPAFTKFDFTFSQWSGTLKALPFTATLLITMKDGTRFTRSESGTYNGVTFGAIHQQYENEEGPPNSKVTRCR